MSRERRKTSELAGEMTTDNTSLNNVVNPLKTHQFLAFRFVSLPQLTSLQVEAQWPSLRPVGLD